ncbi:MAG: LysM peptidoglycan-binding domain-containing protein [Myxococcota bacterium]
MDVWDDDWTPTAHFVDTVLRYLFPDKQTMHDIAMAKKEAELIDRAREFAQATKEAQLQRMLERGKEKIQKLRGFVKRLNSSKILIPAWLNPDTLEQKMLKEANDKAFQIGQKKLDDKAHKIDRNLRDQEEQEASAQSPMDAVDNEENKCATGPKELKDQEREEKRDNLVIDAKAKGKTGKAEEKEQADNAEKDDEVARLSGSDCGSGGPGNTEQCEPVVCECEPKPTAVEKKINPPKLQTHTVVKGDWLIKIAREKLGDMNRWREIYTLNKDVVGNNPNLIFPGQKLVLPPPPDEGKKEPKEGDKKEETEDKAPAGGEECTCENPNPNPDPDPNPNPDDPVDPTPDPDPTPPVVDPVPPIDDPVPDPDTTSTSGTQGEGTDPVAPTTSTTGPQGEGTGPVGPAVCAESGGECKGGGPVAPPEKHTVVKGDWLTRIARDKLGDMKRWKEIWHLNRKVIGENPDLIFPGQVLVLPPKKTRAQKAPGGRGGTNRQVAKSETHTVVRGDWLSKIARDRLGNMRRWKEIYSLNVKTIGDDPNLILPGQVLVLPPRDPDEAKAAPAGEECVCPQPGTTSTAGVGGEPTGPTPPAPSGPAEVAVSAPVTTAEGAENALFKDVIIEGAGQETLDRSSDPATLSKEAVDNAGKQKEGESAGPKMTFKAYDDLIAEIREKVQSYIDASKFAAGFGAANAFEQLLEELEADKADLEEKKGIATEAFEKQVKGQQEPTQARIEEMKQQNAEQFAQEIKDSEADLVDIKEADTHYRQSVPFEMGKLDKIQTSLAAGEAVDEAEVNAAFVKFEFAPDLKVGAWTRSMVARLRKLYSDYTRYYEAIRGAGSVAANKNLAKELSKEIEKFKAEQSQGLEHFDGETPEEKKKEQEAREKAKKNNEVYKPKPPSPEKRKEQEKLERSKADMEFQFTELESLKSAVESGEDADRGEQMDSKQLRETLKSGFEKGGLPDVDKWASYFITVLNQKYADYEADNEVVKGSGSAGASKALARSLGKQLKKLNWLFDQTMKYFESAFAQAVDEGEAAAGQSAEGGQAAEGGQTNPTENPADKVKRAREGKVTLLKRKLPLQNTLDNLENLKSAIESGEAVTQSNAKVVELTDTASFERYADGVKASISKLWPKYTGMADQIRGVGSADAPKALARKLGQEKKDLQNGYERSKELFEKIFEKKQDEKKAGKSDAGDAAADKTSDEESKKDAAVAAKDKMLETEFNLLDRLEKQISENKPISEPSAADRRDIGAELKEKYGDKATVQNLEDWLKTFTGAIAREASKYRGTYEVVRGAGSAGALEDLGTMIEEEATRRQSEIGATFTFFNSALGRKKDGESEDAVKERKNRIREIRYCADDALASLNELKAAVANMRRRPPARPRRVTGPGPPMRSPGPALRSISGTRNGSWRRGTTARPRSRSTASSSGLAACQR